MSFLSDLFSSSQDQTQNTTQNSQFNNTSAFNNNTNSTFGTNGTSTSTPTAPDWVTAAIRGATGATTGLAGRNPLDFVAGPNGDLTQASRTVAGLSGSPWLYNGAADATGAVMNAAAPHTSGVQASPFIKQYMDPYLNDVVNTTLADFDKSAGATRAQDDLNLAGSGAFGGSGAALTKSLTEGELQRARASTDAGLRSQGFAQALGAAGQDAGRLQGAKDLNAQLQAQQLDRTLAAANQLTGIGSSYDANQRANAAAQSGIGSILQQIQQQRAAAPLALAQFGTQNLSDLLRGFFGGTTTTANSGTSSGTNTGTTNSSGTSSGTSSGSGTVTNNPSAMSDIGDILAIAAMFAG